MGTPPQPSVHLFGGLTCGLALAGLLAIGSLGRRFALITALVAGAASIAATLLTLALRVSTPDVVDTSVWTIVEAVALTALVYFAVLWADRAASTTAAAVPAIATPLLLYRFDFDGDRSVIVTGLSIWFVPAAAAAGVALYRRWLAAGRRRAVADARREQRLDLANDLQRPPRCPRRDGELYGPDSRRPAAFVHSRR
ncbi:MAG TPA: hypothetical protein VHG10_05370 [Glycomyces sp.]|nr:hypothetical protein [Glycomyces sp.]